MLQEYEDAMTEFLTSVRARDTRQRSMRQRRPGRIAKAAQRNAELGARHRRLAPQVAQFQRGFASRRWRRAVRPQKSRR